MEQNLQKAEQDRIQNLLLNKTIDQHVLDTELLSERKHLQTLRQQDPIILLQKQHRKDNAPPPFYSNPLEDRYRYSQVRRMCPRI